MSLLLFKGDGFIINLTALFLEKREEAFLFENFDRNSFHFEINTNYENREDVSDFVISNSNINHTSIFVMPTKELRHLVHEANFLVESRGYPIEKALLIELRRIYGNEVDGLIRGE